jgi:hypothetical protein
MDKASQQFPDAQPFEIGVAQGLYKRMSLAVTRMFCFIFRQAVVEGVAGVPFEATVLSLHDGCVIGVNLVVAWG